MAYNIWLVGYDGVVVSINTIIISLNFIKTPQNSIILTWIIFKGITFS